MTTSDCVGKTLQDVLKFQQKEVLRLTKARWVCVDVGDWETESFHMGMITAYNISNDLIKGIIGYMV